MASESNSTNDRLRIFFVPFPTAGHVIPMVHAARVFSRHGGVDATIVATPATALTFADCVAADSATGHKISVRTIPFPAAEVGLPEGVENLQAAATPKAWQAVHRGFGLLRGPMERLFREARPDCLVTDMFFAWTADAAAELAIPRLVFRSSGYFEQCALDGLRRYYDGSNDSSTDVVSLPELPGKIEFLRSQVSHWIRNPTEYTRLMDAIADSERRSYGVIFNTFREMEGPYEDYFKTTLGIKSWSLGPYSLWLNRRVFDQPEGYCFSATTRAVAEAERHEVLKWLDSKETSSVLYVAFGSLTRFNRTQLGELAAGLAVCGHPFVWVVWREIALPEGFEESGTGFLVKGWAPQDQILRHSAVGGMVTHCGWNSLTEALTAGLPVVTWPMFAEQFYNEKLLAEVLGVGVPVGAKEWRFHNFEEETAEVMTREQIKSAAAALMGGGADAADRRERARRLADAAAKAVESGGSSHVNLMYLINELKSLKIQRNAKT